MSALDTEELPNFFNVIFALNIGDGNEVSPELYGRVHIYDVLATDHREVEFLFVIKFREVKGFVRLKLTIEFHTANYHFPGVYLWDLLFSSWKIRWKPFWLLISLIQNIMSRSYRLKSCFIGEKRPFHIS